MTPAVISSSSASVMPAFSRSQLRNRSIGSRRAHSSNISLRHVRRVVVHGVALHAERDATRSASGRRRPAPSRSRAWPRGRRRARRCRRRRRPRTRSRWRGRRGGRSHGRGTTASSTPTGCCRSGTRPAGGGRRRSSSPRARRRGRPRPSPHQASATRRSSRIRKASAMPTATGSMAGRWLTIACSPSRASPRWTLPSRPRVGPSSRPMYCAKIRHGSTPRVMWTPMSRCSGQPTSSGPIAAPTPTAAASLPRPV